MKNKFRINSNKKVYLNNAELVKPELSNKDYIIRTFSLTASEEEKLNSLRAKYKVSRSAILRILLNSAE